jgi:polyphosphate kinase
MQAGDHKGLYTTRPSRRWPPRRTTLVARQYALYNDELMPSLQEARHEHHLARRPQPQPGAGWMTTLSARCAAADPGGAGPGHPFPQVANKSLNFIVQLWAGKDAFGRENEIAIVKVPRVLPRLIRMPAKVAPGRSCSCCCPA